jgi:hypothetical protein
MHSSGTIINGSQIRTGEIASHDEKTKFDLDGDQIVINETVDRVILGKTAAGKYGIKIQDASGNLMMQVDDDDQIIQSADGKTSINLNSALITLSHPTANIKSVLCPSYLGKTFDDSHYHYYPIAIELEITAESDGSLDYLLWESGVKDEFNLGSYFEYYKLRLVCVLEDFPYVYKSIDGFYFYGIAYTHVYVRAPAGTFTNSADGRLIFISFATW